MVTVARQLSCLAARHLNDDIDIVMNTQYSDRAASALFSPLKFLRQALVFKQVVSHLEMLIGNDFNFCEAQGKGRAKGRPRRVTKRSFIDMDGGWWLSFP